MEYPNGFLSDMEAALLNDNTHLFNNSAYNLYRWIEETNIEPDWQQYRMATRMFIQWEDDIGREVRKQLEEEHGQWDAEQYLDDLESSQQQLPF